LAEAFAGMVKEAGGFANVSNQAMIIRLQDLGLVGNNTYFICSGSNPNLFF